MSVINVRWKRIGENEVEWTGKEQISKAYFLAVREARKAILFWPISGGEFSPQLSIAEIFISESVGELVLGGDS